MVDADVAEAAQFDNGVPTTYLLRSDDGSVALTDGKITMQVCREVFLVRIPLGRPVFLDGEAEADWIYFLTHNLNFLIRACVAREASLRLRLALKQYEYDLSDV